MRHADDYLSVLSQDQIVVGVQDRQQRIWASVEEAAASVGGTVPEASKQDLLLEVANLVEAPTVILGSFDRAFLELPR